MTDISLNFVFVVLLASFFIGLAATSIFRHPSLRRSLIAITASTRRILSKHNRLSINYRPREQFALIKLGITSESDIKDYSKRGPDPAAIDAATSFCTLLNPGRRKDIIGVCLFGSRARGDYENTSDVDIAILFSGQCKIGISMYLKVYMASFIAIFSHGLYLQVRILRPGSKGTAILLPHIRRDGISVWDANMSAIFRE